MAAPADLPLTPEQQEKLRAFLAARHFRAERRDGETVYSRHVAGFYGSFLTHPAILLALFFGSLTLITPQVSGRTVMPGATITLVDGTRVTCLAFQSKTRRASWVGPAVCACKAPTAHSKRRRYLGRGQPAFAGASFLRRMIEGPLRPHPDRSGCGIFAFQEFHAKICIKSDR